MAATFTPNEQAQLNQTIEMFEVITQAQPSDHQSLEILKEAYMKMDRQQDVVRTSKRIAQAYFQEGQLSSAILEYESILQFAPDDPDVRKALTEIESRADSFSSKSGGDSDLFQKSTADTSPFAPPPAPAASPFPPAPSQPTSPFAPRGQSPAPGSSAPFAPTAAVNGDRGGKPSSEGIKMAVDRRPTSPQQAVDDGREAMSKLFVDSKLITPAEFGVNWFTPSLNDTPMQICEPFVHILAEKGVLPIDKSLPLIAEKSRLPYIAMDKYDVDLEVSRNFGDSRSTGVSKEICMRWCILPFDRMSKSILVATVNPFNKQAALDLEQHTRNRIIWYLCQPEDLMKMIKKTFRI